MNQPLVKYPGFDFCAVFLTSVTRGHKIHKIHDFGTQTPYAARLAMDGFEIMSGVEYAVLGNPSRNFVFSNYSNVGLLIMLRLIFAHHILCSSTVVEYMLYKAGLTSERRHTRRHD
jgi:hypothetical protein